MFIFTALLHLIMLPFTLLRMGFGLLGISTHILLFPLKIIARHTIACIVIAGVLILYFALKKEPHALDTLKPASVAEQGAPRGKGKNTPPLIQPVTKYEDGDSVFATDAYAMMSDPERLAYSQNFYQIMGTVADGTTQNWGHYNIQGAITPTVTFRNKSGALCRRFSEVLKVHTLQQTITGIACDNGAGSWCKLKVNATPQCGLGHTPGALDGLGNAVGNLFN